VKDKIGVFCKHHAPFACSKDSGAQASGVSSVTGRKIEYWK
jgi:hypothetical protein